MLRRIATLGTLAALACGESTLREPSPTAARLIAEAGARTEACEWDAALELLQQALAADPESADAALAAGRLLKRMGELPEALEQFDMANRRAPRDPRPLLELARLYRDSGRPENADHAIEAAAAAAGRDPAVLIEVGRLHLQRDETWRAADALGAALRANPKEVEAIYLLGVMEARRQAWGEAELQLRRAVELAPGHEAAHIELARLLSTKDRQREAIALLQRFERTAGRASASLLSERAAIYTRWGDTAAAGPIAAAATQAEAREQQLTEGWSRLWTAGDDVEVRRALAKLLLEQGDREAATGLLCGCTHIQPDDQAAWRALLAFGSGACASEAEARLLALASSPSPQIPLVSPAPDVSPGSP